jgi:hypothetical protein
MEKSTKDLYLISKGVVQAFIRQKSQFTLEEVKQEILKRNGIMRVSTGVTILDYLEEFERNEVLRFELDDKDGHYRVLKESNRES